MRTQTSVILSQASDPESATLTYSLVGVDSGSDAFDIEFVERADQDQGSAAITRASRYMMLTVTATDPGDFG